ncbi:hypothetical protein ACFE04_025909 [Oxalis oulophora]
MKYEGRYTMEPMFDGSKLGIQPCSLHMLSDGKLIASLLLFLFYSELLDKEASKIVETMKKGKMKPASLSDLLLGPIDYYQALSLTWFNGFGFDLSNSHGYDVVPMACPKRYVVGLEILENVINKGLEFRSQLLSLDCRVALPTNNKYVSYPLFLLAEALYLFVFVCLCVFMLDFNLLLKEQLLTSQMYALLIVRSCLWRAYQAPIQELSDRLARRMWIKGSCVALDLCLEKDVATINHNHLPSPTATNTTITTVIQHKPNAATRRQRKEGTLINPTPRHNACRNSESQSPTNRRRSETNRDLDINREGEEGDRGHDYSSGVLHDF